MSVQQLGFCPKCRQNVTLRKKELDICLLIILFSFTAGIGGIIYLIIWALQPADSCVLCGSQTIPLAAAPQLSSVSSTPSNFNNQSNTGFSEPIKSQTFTASAQSASENFNKSPQFDTEVQYQEKKDVEKKFCPYCGNELIVKAKFCGVCGSTLQ